VIKFNVVYVFASYAKSKKYFKLSILNFELVLMTKKQKILLAIVIFVLLFHKIIFYLILTFLPILVFATIVFFSQKKDFLKEQLNKIQKQADKMKTGSNPLDYDKLFKNNLFSNFFSMPKFKVSAIFMAIFVLLIAFVIIDGFVSVPAGHAAVIYDRGRGVLEEELPEGLHLKIPFWQSATIVDTRLQTYTMSIATAEGEVYGDDAIEALTKDGQKVYVDVTVQYRIASEDASYVYQKIGLDYKNKIIRPEVRSIIREVVTGYESKSLFNLEPRQQAAQQMEDSLKARYADKKIVLESLLLRNIQFSTSYIEAIEEKQIAEQKIQKAEYEKQEAEKIKEKKIIEAEAEAEAIRLKGETLKQNPQVIQFEFVQKMAPNIDWGIMPDNIVPLVDLKGINQ